MNLVFNLSILLVAISCITGEDDASQESPVNDSEEASTNLTVISQICGSSAEIDGVPVPTCECIGKLMMTGDLFLESDTGGKVKENRPHVQYKCVTDTDTNATTEFEGTPYRLNLRFDDGSFFNTSLLQFNRGENGYILTYLQGMDENSPLNITYAMIGRGLTELYEYPDGNNNISTICDSYEPGTAEYVIWEIVTVGLTNGTGCSIKSGTEINLPKYLPPINFVFPQPMDQGYYSLVVNITSSGDEQIGQFMWSWAVPDGYFIDTANINATVLDGF